MRITTCTEADVAVLERHFPSGRNTVHALHFQRQQTGVSEYLLAWEDGVPVGYGVVNLAGFRDAGPRAAHPNCPEISNLGVVETRRGRGIGSALIAAAEVRVRELGYPQAGLAVAVDNADALRLYERLGYRDTGIRCETGYSWEDDEGVRHDVVEVCRYLVRDLSGYGD